MRLRKHERTGTESGFAALWVVGMLALAGVVVAAFLHLGPLSMRAAVNDLHRVRALDYAESGVAYALAWFQSEQFDPRNFSDSLATLVRERELGDGGGYRDLDVIPRGNGEYVIRAVGYQQVREGTEVTRAIETAIRLRTMVTGAVFPRHWLWMLTGDEEQDKNHPINDPNDPAYGYEPVDITVEPVPEWSMPSISSASCPAYGTNLRNVSSECRWPGTYSLGWESRDTHIAGARLWITGNMDVGGSWKLTASDSVLRVDQNLTFGGSSDAFFDDVTFYVGKNASFGGSNDSRFDGTTVIHTGGDLSVGGSGEIDFYGDTTFYVNGNLNLGGSGRLRFHEHVTAYVDGDLTISGAGLMYFGNGATFYVNGKVTISGSGWTSGRSGEDAPWISFFVKKNVSISGAAGAGASIPDAAFLLDTDPAYSHYGAQITGSGNLYGGIYAPTRNISLSGSPNVTGSLVGKTLEIPPYLWNNESAFRNKYDQHADRMRSYVLKEGTVRRTQERLSEWREVSVGP